jgi:hypothetical protein
MADFTTATFSFDEGELRIVAFGEEMKIRGWPGPHASTKNGKAVWRDFRPTFRLLKPAGDSNESAGLHDSPEPDEDGKGNQEISQLERKERAFEAFRTSVPQEIVTGIERFQSHQWNVIDLVDKNERALDVLGTNPSIAFCLANCDQFRKGFTTTPAIHASHVVERKQREILGWLDFPPTDAVRRIFKKIQPEAITPSEARLLRNVIKSEPMVLKLLMHQPCINTGILGIVTSLKLLNAVSHRLLAEVGADSREAIYAHTADRLLDSLWMLWEMGRRTVLPTFNSIEAIREYHQTVHQDHERRFEEQKRQFRALMEAKARLLSQTQKVKTSDFHPPLPGTEDIVPLTSPGELREEGKAQNNCVGSYSRRVRSGRIYIYKVLKPERATLAITRGDGGWIIAELEVAGNKPVVPDTHAAVARWLAMHSLSV